MDFIDFYRSSLFLSPEEENSDHDATKAKAGEDDRGEDFLRSSHTLIFQLGAVYHHHPLVFWGKGYYSKRYE